MNKTMGTNNGILTIKDLMNALVGLPEGTQIIAENDELFNIVGIEFPNFKDTFAVTLKTADTFDPRQF